MGLSIEGIIMVCDQLSKLIFFLSHGYACKHEYAFDFCMNLQFVSLCCLDMGTCLFVIVNLTSVCFRFLLTLL